LPESIEVLRSVRRNRHGGEVVRLSASASHNLAGIIIAGLRIAAIRASSIVFRDVIYVDAEEDRPPLVGGPPPRHSPRRTNVRGGADACLKSNLRH
jgi:hypothetical protein